MSDLDGATAPDKSQTSQCIRCKTIDGCICGRSAIGILAHTMGDRRTEAEMVRDGACVTIGLIDKLRRQLDQAERACQHVQLTGKVRKDDDAIWRRVDRAARKLLDGMV